MEEALAPGRNTLLVALRYPLVATIQRQQWSADTMQAFSVDMCGVSEAQAPALFLRGGSMTLNSSMSPVTILILNHVSSGHRQRDLFSIND